MSPDPFPCIGWGLGMRLQQGWVLNDAHYTVTCGKYYMCIYIYICICVWSRNPGEANLLFHDSNFRSISDSSRLYKFSLGRVTCILVNKVYFSLLYNTMYKTGNSKNMGHSCSKYLGCSVIVVHCRVSLKSM